jgi:cation:H+ antiporter
MGAVGLLLGGFVVLVAGGELLVRGASGLAEAMGMSPLVVGLTVVSFATSAPELAVTLQAVQDGSPDLAVGNVVGSNIANVLLVLGIAALIGPLAVRSQLVRVDVPVLVGMGVLLLLLSLDGLINRTNGALLFSCLVGYVILAVLMGRRESARAVPGAALSDDSPDTAPGAQPAPGPWRHVANLALLVVGVALLVVGAGWLVEGATRIAVERGIPQMVIGLTIVAIGTSLPELATTVIAALRGQRDLAVGNAVGSSIFNIGAVLGFSSLLAPQGIPVAESAIRVDIPIMIAVSVALLPVLYTGFEIRRWEGALFLGLYLAYTGYLLLNATDHQRLPAYSAVMLWFVLPTVAVSLGALAGFDAGLRKGRAQSRDPDRGPAPAGDRVRSADPPGGGRR